MRADADAGARAVVVTEENKTCSVASELAARIYHLVFDELDAPVEVVSGADVPMPYARNLEKLCAPDEPAILEAARRTLWRSGGGPGGAEGRGFHAGAGDAEDGRRDGGGHHPPLAEERR